MTHFVINKHLLNIANSLLVIDVNHRILFYKPKDYLGFLNYAVLTQVAKLSQHLVIFSTKS